MKGTDLGVHFCAMPTLIDHQTNRFQVFPTTKIYFQNIHLDVVDPLASSQGLKYCLTLIDQFA